MKTIKVEVEAADMEEADQTELQSIMMKYNALCGCTTSSRQFLKHATRRRLAMQLLSRRMKQNQCWRSMGTCMDPSGKSS
jgi:hypothetical protein